MLFSITQPQQRIKSNEYNTEPYYPYKYNAYHFFLVPIGSLSSFIISSICWFLLLTLPSKPSGFTVTVTPGDAGVGVMSSVGFFSAIVFSLIREGGQSLGSVDPAPLMCQGY